MHGTTILAVRRDGLAAVAGDGQVTLNQSGTILKHRAKKVRRIFGGKVVVGFAGSVADALTLFDRFEARLEQSHGNLPRAAVDLAREWRTDRMLRRLDALLLAVDAQSLLLISGSGDVVEPDEPLAAIGSGSSLALAAAQGLLAHTGLSAREIVVESLRIVSRICVYTNDELTVEEV
jgi:ATP-dependent HslUV protease subunit HslV